MSPAEAAKLAKWIDGIVEAPTVTLRRAEERLTVAKLHLESAKLYLPALEARLAADREKYLHPTRRTNQKLRTRRKRSRNIAAFASEATVEAQQLLATDKAGAPRRNSKPQSSGTGIRHLLTCRGLSGD